MVAEASGEDELPQGEWSQRQSSGQHLGNISLQKVDKKGGEREVRERDQEGMS